MLRQRYSSFYSWKILFDGQLWGSVKILPTDEINFFFDVVKDFPEAYSLSKIYKIVQENTLKFSKLILSSDNKKILLTTKKVRLNSGHYATRYYYDL